MNITVRFFASLRESLQTAGTELSLSAQQPTVNSVIHLLCEEHPTWQAVLTQPTPMIAVNQSMAGTDTPISPGDEVAFFPPMTGG